MRQKKTLVLAERDLGGNRIYVVKSMVNSIGYSIGKSSNNSTEIRFTGIITPVPMF